MEDSVYADKYLVLDEISSPNMEAEKKDQPEKLLSSTKTHIDSKKNASIGGTMRPKFVPQSRYLSQIPEDRESRNDSMNERQGYKTKRQGVQFKTQTLVYLYFPEEEFDDVVVVEK